MMFRHVMVPYDGSDHAKNALNYAKDLVAGDADAKLSVVHAVPSSYMGVDRMGTDGALDGVPYGMLDYEEYQGVVKRVLDAGAQTVLIAMPAIVYPKAVWNFFSSKQAVVIGVAIDYPPEIVACAVINAIPFQF